VQLKHNTHPLSKLTPEDKDDQAAAIAPRPNQRQDKPLSQLVSLIVFSMLPCRATTSTLCEFSQRHRRTLPIGIPATAAAAAAAERMLVPGRTYLCAFYSSSTSKSKNRLRRRKCKSLLSDESSFSAAHTKATTKDRMRRLVETNIVTKKPSISLKEFNKLYEVANSRLSWIRNKVFSIWNADYNTNTTTTATSTAKEQKRPIRHGPIMDATWWFWNVAFALLPAVLIGLYCELRGEDLVVEYKRRKQLDDIRRVIGDDELVNAIVSDQKREEATPFTTRLWTMLDELSSKVTTLFLGKPSSSSGQEEPLSGSGDDGARPPCSPAKEQPALPVPGLSPAALGPTSTIVSTPSTPNTTPPSACSPEDIQAITTPPSAYSPEDIQAILGRIEQLEVLVKDQQQRRTRDIQYQLERLNQSGVKNRIDDKLIDSFKAAPAVTKVPDRSVSQVSESSSSSSNTSDHSAFMLRMLRSIFDQPPVETKDLSASAKLTTKENEPTRVGSVLKSNSVESVPSDNSQPRKAELELEKGSSGDDNASASTSDTIRNRRKKAWWDIW
jgi:hypothetical protein